MDIYIRYRITGSIGANMNMDTYQLHLNISMVKTGQHFILIETKLEIQIL